MNQSQLQIVVSRVLVSVLLLLIMFNPRACFAQCEVIRLVPPEQGIHDHFGTSIDIQGDTIIVGAPVLDKDDPRPGYADIFRKQKGTWRHEARLASPNVYPENFFGRSVLLVHDLALITATRDHDGRVNFVSLNIFKRTGHEWTFLDKIELPAFGFSTSMATDGRRVVIGSPGGTSLVNVFQLHGKNLIFEQQLVPPDRPSCCWPSGFGSAVAIDGDRIIVGHPGDTTYEGNGIGSAYIFRYDRTAKSFVQEARLLPTGFQPYSFGITVGLDGDVAMVGQDSFFENDVQVFEADGGGWSLKQRLYPPNITGFQSALLFRDSMALIASKNCVPESIPGISCTPGIAHVYLSDPDTHQWTHEMPLRLRGRFPEGELDGMSVRSIDLEGGVAVLGFPSSNHPAFRAGAAYVFTGLDSLDENFNDRPDACDVPGDVNGDGLVNVTDLLALLAAWGPCTLCPADIDRNGSVDVFDLIELLSNWQ